ncbi:hypothetical protein WN55_11230 [Dufourea novaeangliae]|uniref:Uncharacterized protein n=1 Tax=Dufourea novaeangliae TaxID=178035 RepID=A0A154P9S3_DUFNO|nr:hypothetical protein WN55_11230 [Dufourea novaeangliae]
MLEDTYNTYIRGRSESQRMLEHFREPKSAFILSLASHAYVQTSVSVSDKGAD